MDHATWATDACVRCGQYRRACTDCRTCERCHETPGRPSPEDLRAFEEALATHPPRRPALAPPPGDGRLGRLG